MRFKTRLVLVGGCIVLAALSIPAYSLPASKQSTHVKPPLPMAKPKQAAQRPVAAPAPRARSAPVEQVSLSANMAKPALGWPALVVEARKYMGTNPTARSRLWCATFMNMVLAKVGYAGTNSDAAKSFAYYGRRISEPRVGAIAVLTRGKNGGHVGVVSGIDSSGNPVIISGNHNKRVGEAIYARSRVIAYVMPTDRRAVPTMVARGPASVPASESGLESPIAELIAAIEAEQARAETPRPAEQPQRAQVAQRPPVQQVQPQQAQPQPPAVPHRVVQQTAEPLPQQRAQDNARRAATTNPFSELIGRIERTSPPQTVPQRAAPRAAGRVAAAETGHGIR
jgi:uncharacterized protein (TIGR02594 family)